MDVEIHDVEMDVEIHKIELSILPDVETWVNPCVVCNSVT